MSRKVILSSKFVVAGLLVLLAGGCSGNNGAIDGTGTIEAREIDVSALASGTVERLLVEEGARTEKGELLAEVDHGILDLRLQQAVSREKQARAQLELLRAGARSEDIEQAKARLEQARHNFELAQKEWNRMQTLYAEGSIPKREYDTVENQYENSRAAYEGAQAAFKKVQDPVRVQEIESAEAALEQAAAEADIARRQIDDSSIRAPMGGFISEVYYEEGEFVQAGRQLLTILDMDRMYVTVYLSGPTLARISLGEAARVYVDGVPDSSFRGSVSFISEEAEFTPKNVQTREERVKLVYAVRVDVENREGILKPGMPADVIFEEKEDE